MREIGGYLEIENNQLPMLHENAMALNSGRNALAYLFKTREIKKIWIPILICDAIAKVCERESVDFGFYKVGIDLLPKQDIVLKDNEWFYFVNYYSQFDNRQINSFVKKYKRVIVDNAHSYFQAPIPGIDTIYTCRKYFGVTDGAFLYTDVQDETKLPLDESYERMRHVLGRYERNAHEFYEAYTKNEDAFFDMPVKQMSKLTKNLLHGIDYTYNQKVRRDNYAYLYQQYEVINELNLSREGTFMYPLLLEKGAAIRKKLHESKIYIPTIWPNVLDWSVAGETEYYIANNTLPIPIDQRYGIEEMKYIIEVIKSV